MKESKLKNTVPAFVDDIKNIKEFKFTRLNYFYIDLSEPDEEQIIRYISELPIIIIGNEGVIISGLENNILFDKPETISELFDYMDDKTPFVVNTGYFWLPNKLVLNYITEKLSRQSVLRVSIMETEAFKKWTDLTIDRVKNRYHERSGQNLRYRSLK
jgi:hypothetical protein